MFYRHTPDRKGEHLRAHLRQFRSLLQADGYAGFAGPHDDGGSWKPPALRMHGASLGTCMRVNKSPLAREALDRIAALYRIEDTIRTLVHLINASRYASRTRCR